MKPKVLAIMPGLIPSTIFGVVNPLLDLHRAGQVIAKISWEPTIHKKDVEWSDLVILCRNIDPLTSRWFLDLLKHGKPYIYDIDDNFFDIPLDMPLGKYYRAVEHQAMLREYLVRANLIRVYSLPMLERVKDLNPNVVHVTGPVDWRLLHPSKKVVEGNKVKIVYATSRVNDTLAEIFKPALNRIIEKYPDQIEVHFLGYNPSEFKKYPNVFFKGLTLNYRQYLKDFSQASFDIGLAPLLNDIFHRSKTNVKVREYGACRIAGIYSDVDVYSSSVISGHTGLLVQNDSNSWFEAMSNLIEDRQFRKHICENAYCYAYANFSHISFNQIWYEQIIQTVQQPTLDKGNLDVLADLIFPNKESFSSARVSQDAFSFRKLKRGYEQIDAGLSRLWLSISLPRKLVSVISRLKSEGIGFLHHALKMKFEVFWMKLQIKFTLFFS